MSGLLISHSAFDDSRQDVSDEQLSVCSAGVDGAVKDIWQSFRSLSSSGATISDEFALGVTRVQVREFCFVLAQLMIPPILFKAGFRFLNRHSVKAINRAGISMQPLLLPSLLGIALSFASGSLALYWLSSWMAKGQWFLSRVYCLFESMVVCFVS